MSDAQKGWIQVAAGISAMVTVVLLECFAFTFFARQGDVLRERAEVFQACVDKADDKAAITTVDACSRIAQETIK